MKRGIFRIVVMAALVLCASCSASAISHDEDKAARAAIQFAKVALVQHDTQKGYSLLSESASKTITMERFTQVMSELHPTSYPVSVTAKEYEPIPGKRGMNVLLLGQNGAEQFHYRFEMEGTSGDGYRVSGIYRGNGPYPGSQMKQTLKTEYSTDN